MTEQEYIIVTNRVKVKAALELMCDVTPGSEYGISQSKYEQILTRLVSAEKRLFDAVPKLTGSE